MSKPSRPPSTTTTTTTRAADDVLEKPVTIRSVWSSNLESEFDWIRQVIDSYPHISMDTEFPGALIQKGLRHWIPDECYANLKKSVDPRKLIQLGITLTDYDGNLPDLGIPGEHYVWEFNFSDFDVSNDVHNPSSIQLLRDHGIDLEKNRELGVKLSRFSELMMSSGLVCNDEVSYVVFHGGSDFGYLIKNLTGRVLPEKLEDFVELVRIFFGERVYDVKHVIKNGNGLYGGLNQVAKTLGVSRVSGGSHQAGSDSLLTWHTFQKIREVYFKDDERLMQEYAGVVYQLELLPHPRISHPRR
ncbi:hypothetical protein ACH5RR_004510 [Cinchona calisaya]|uniref:poly(A)-specific ribonuclease n=1 Tax=Cinchona calisaya TaxID=153742 RepID=A0ABD3AXU9_9GENT